MCTEAKLLACGSSFLCPWRHARWTNFHLNTSFSIRVANGNNFLSTSWPYICEVPVVLRCHYINSQTKHSLVMVSRPPNCHKILLKFHQLSCVYTVRTQYLYSKCVPYGSVNAYICARLLYRYTLCWAIKFLDY